MGLLDPCYLLAQVVLSPLKKLFEAEQSVNF